MSLHHRQALKVPPPFARIRVIRGPFIALWPEPENKNPPSENRAPRLPAMAAGLTVQRSNSIYSSMKTTFDLPEDLLHRAKIIAAQRKTTLKEMVLRGLEYVTSHELPDPETERRRRNQALLDALSAIRITEPVGRLHRDEIHERPQGREQ
jgi:hypothetical protein